MRSSTSIFAITALLAVTPALAQTETPAEDPALVQPSTEESVGEGDSEMDASGEANVEVETTGEAEVEVETTGEPEVIVTQEPADAEDPAMADTEMETETEMETDTVETDVETIEAEDAEVAEGTPVEGQMFEQSPSSYLASTLIGAQVQSMDGEDIGEVDDLVLGEDGMIEGVVIGVGGFLGIGEKDIAVEFDTITAQQDEDGDLTFMVDTTEEAMEAAPEFRTQDDIQAEAEADASMSGMDATTTDPMATTTPPAAVDPVTGGTTAPADPATTTQ